MIVLDTNVLSEPLKPQPDVRVLAWLDQQPPESLFLTAISAAELLAGVQRMPAGRRRTALNRAVREQVLVLFEGRLLPFDLAAAEAFAQIDSRTRKAGLTIGFADAQIAAIAAAHRFVVATRDTRPFAAAGIETVDPWRG